MGREPTLNDSMTQVLNSMTGMVFDIQRFSIHDGPGVRTTVFLKGCNLHCFWCHNPESIRHRREVQLFPTKCIGCGDCFSACPKNAHVLQDGVRRFERERCDACGNCTQGCFSGALVMTGKTMSVDEVMTEVLRDKAFYSTTGGVTISGGEPVMQRDFTRAILGRCRDEGLHTAIETAANCKWEDLAVVLEATDLVMTDIKHMDPQKHRSATGVSNERILDNARRLVEYGTPIIFRVPVIPTVNDSPEEIRAIARFIRSLLDSTPNPSMVSVELLQFHRLAGDKYRSLELDYRAANLELISKERMAELASIIAEHGLTA